MIQVRPVEPHEHDSWDSFVAASPQGTLFHTSHWKRTIDAGYGGPKLALWGVFGNQDILGGCVALERTKFGRRTAVTPLLTPYSGCLLAAQVSEKFSSQASQTADVLERLANELKRQYPYQSFINTPPLDDVRALLTAGYRVTPRYTYEINLRLPEDELWSRLDGNVRRQIKKAEGCGFEVTDNVDASKAWQLFDSTFRRRGEHCPAPRSLFLEIIEGSHLKEFRSNYGVISEGALISFVTVLRFKNIIYYSLAATDESKLDLGVSPYLIWEIIRVNAAERMNALDFVGANIPSIARFKEGFNPRLLLHFQTAYFGGLHIKIGRSLRTAFRK